MLQNENVSFSTNWKLSIVVIHYIRNNQSFKKDFGPFKKEIDVTMVQAPK